MSSPSLLICIQWISITSRNKIIVVFFFLLLAFLSCLGHIIDIYKFLHFYCSYVKSVLKIPLAKT